jgi:hypothetical protein
VLQSRKVEWLYLVSAARLLSGERKSVRMRAMVLREKPSILRYWWGQRAVWEETLGELWFFGSSDAAPTLLVQVASHHSRTAPLRSHLAHHHHSHSDAVHASRGPVCYGDACPPLLVLTPGQTDHDALINGAR